MILHYLIEKEVKQMMRNIVLPIVFVLLPVAMMNMVPRVATQEVKNLTVAVVDCDRSTLSARLTEKIDASAYFRVSARPSTYREALSEVERGRADLICEIEPRFERNLVSRGRCDVLISANAVNGMKAGLGSSYLAQTVADYAASLAAGRGIAASGAGAGVDASAIAPFSVQPRYVYNASLDYKVFMIPAIMAMLLVLIVGFLPALNIVGEKEKGTIEQINVTPIGRTEFILSKLIPYWGVGLCILAYAMLLARLLYGIVPEGSVALIFLFSTVFILLVSSLGLIVSNYSDTTQQAALVMFFFLVIFILMSGLITPVASMPRWARALTCANPLRYFIEVMRMLYLKGSTLCELRHHFLILAAFTLVLWAWAIGSYRKRA